ncbi:unnamed protein product [Closterium sp. NIES-65]|nr:unnamed protein product [Closterium sp. NIES-65]
MDSAKSAAASRYLNIRCYSGQADNASSGILSSGTGSVAGIGSAAQNGSAAGSGSAAGDAAGDGSGDGLKGLNEEQRAAVVASPHGCVRVVAGPGSGKTRVLTHRVVNLIKNLGVHPRKILCITFTNRAANELVTRLQDLLSPEAAAAVHVGTFHGIAARILRHEMLPSLRNRRCYRDYTIYDEDDSLRVIKEIDKQEKERLAKISPYQPGKSNSAAARGAAAGANPDGLYEAMSHLSLQSGDATSAAQAAVAEVLGDRGGGGAGGDGVDGDKEGNRLKNIRDAVLRYKEGGMKEDMRGRVGERRRGRFEGELSIGGSIPRYAKLYEDELRRSNALDFDDLTHFLLDLFHTQPHVLKLHVLKVSPRASPSDMPLPPTCPSLRHAPPSDMPLPPTCPSLRHAPPSDMPLPPTCPSLLHAPPSRMPCPSLSRAPSTCPSCCYWQKYQERFQHVLVDEFQDTDSFQYEIVRLLTLNSKRLFVVGDIDQCIYSWRGAEYHYLQRLLDEDFDDVTTLQLRSNYRSSQSILQAANRVIQGGPRDRRVGGGTLELKPTKPPGHPVFFSFFPSCASEAATIAEEIESLVDPAELSPWRGQAGARGGAGGWARGGAGAGGRAWAGGGAREGAMGRARAGEGGGARGGGMGGEMEGEVGGEGAGASGGYAWRDFCVLYRTHAQAVQLQQGLADLAIPCIVVGGSTLFQRKVGCCFDVPRVAWGPRHLSQTTLQQGLADLAIPCIVVGGSTLFQRKVVKDLIAYMRLVANPADSVALGRIYNTPSRGLGAKSWATVQQWAQGLDSPTGTAILVLVHLHGLSFIHSSIFHASSCHRPCILLPSFLC